MTYKAKAAFTGVLGGKEVQFQPGDAISAADALELGLAGKPDLAEPVKKGGANAATA